MASWDSLPDALKADILAKIRLAIGLGAWCTRLDRPPPPEGGSVAETCFPTRPILTRNEPCPTHSDS